MNTSADVLTPDLEHATVLSTADLAQGDQIEAFYNGNLVHRGHVTDIAPKHEVFWITDSLSGSRRLLDIAEFDIIRLTKQPQTTTETAGV